MVGPSWAAVWTLIAGVAVAIVGATATLVANRRNDRLKAQLDFVNMQLRYFYGPLLANVEASTTVPVCYMTTPFLPAMVR